MLISTSFLNAWRLLVLLRLITQVTSTDCFWPDGSEAQGLSRCWESRDESHCCNEKDICLDNGYCLAQGYFSNRVVRGGCTDHTWTSSACPEHCAGVAMNSSISVLVVGETSDPGVFCCGTGYDITTGMCQYPDGMVNHTYTPFAIPNSHILLSSSRKNEVTNDSSNGSSISSTSPTNFSSSGDSGKVDKGWEWATIALLIVTVLLIPLAIAGIHHIRHRHTCHPKRESSPVPSSVPSIPQSNSRVSWM